MATTTNYGWTTPDDTALVKDGASAIRTLGTAIDTTTFNNAAAAIAKTIVDAKGDIIAATAADTVSRLAVGANDTVLTADSTAATGLKWATAAAGGMTLLSTTTLSGATVAITGIAGGYNSLRVFVFGVTNATNNGTHRIAPNGTTNISYTIGRYGDSGATNTSYVQGSAGYLNLTDTGSPDVGRTQAENMWIIEFPNYTNTANPKPFFSYGVWRQSGSAPSWNNQSGMILTNSAITSLTFSASGGNLSTGTVLIYGVK
jgi:hypothetical protein